MAGALSTGRTKNCNAIKSGGISSLHLADRKNIVSITQDVDGKVTAVTMVALEVFYKYEFKANSAQFVESLTNEGGLQITQTLNQVWESWTQGDRNILMEWASANCGLVAIHRENTGLSWFWGFDETEEVYLFTSERDAGTAKSDPNQIAPVLQALATSPANEFTGTIPV